MAGMGFSINSAGVTMVNNTAKTCLQVTAGANKPLLIKSLKVMGKQAAGGTDAVGLIQAYYNTTQSGTGTTATAVKHRLSDAGTLLVTGKSNFTVEPTSPVDLGRWWYVQPQTGFIDYFPPGLEIYVPALYSISFVATFGGTPTLLFACDGEE